jgi:hypothetical protein
MQSVSLWNQLSNLHETLYECYAIGDQLQIVLYITQQSVKTIWRKRELVCCKRHQSHLFYGPEIMRANEQCGICVR